jgi:phosphate transport system permease protein
MRRRRDASSSAVSTQDSQMAYATLSNAEGKTASVLQQQRSNAVGSFRLTDRVFHNVTFVAALFVLILLGAIILSLIVGAWPAMSKFGIGFLYGERWSVNKEIFGALSPIYGTLMTSSIAMLIAVPIGLGIAIFLTELCPPSLRRPIGIAIELLAGIPSIIYGIWGFFTLTPFFGQTLLTASLILAIMVLPFITAIARDVFSTVPPVLKEAAYGIGCTTWEVAKNVVLPYTRVGVVGGVMLGLGRALGETMAVTFVIGNSHTIAASLLSPATTISATIANEFQESDGIYRSSLLELGLLLFVITFFVLAAARILLMRLERKAGA